MGKDGENVMCGGSKLKHHGGRKRKEKIEGKNVILLSVTTVVTKLLSPRKTPL